MLFNLLDAAAEGGETVAQETTKPFWTSFLDSTTVQGQVAIAAIKVVLALLIMFISFKIINLITRSIYKKLKKRGRDETLSRVGTQAARVILKILVTVCLIGFVGIEISVLAGLIASLGVGISLAVQGTLANFAGGVIIIIMRPFKIGDFITSNGESGTVEDIKLFYTHIVTPDNRAVVIPNGALANNVIVNASAKDTRRVDLVASVAYGSDVAKVKEIIMSVCSSNELVMQDPAPFVELSNMGDSSLDFTVRAWCNRVDYWTVNFALLDSILKTLNENGIEIPYNKLDVNIKEKEEKETKRNKSNG